MIYSVVDWFRRRMFPYTLTLPCGTSPDIFRLKKPVVQAEMLSAPIVGNVVTVDFKS